MKYLIDTHVIIWFLSEPQHLSKKMKEILQNTSNTILFSPISFWEISIKFGSGKLDLGNLIANELPQKLIEIGFEEALLSSKNTASHYQLSATYHRDPFDRMLIWQAIQNNHTLVSDDATIRKYTSEGLKLVW